MCPGWWQVPMTKPWVGSVRFEDDFDSPTLDESLWLLAYGPSVSWGPATLTSNSVRSEKGNGAGQLPQEHQASDRGGLP